MITSRHIFETLIIIAIFTVVTLFVMGQKNILVEKISTSKTLMSVAPTKVPAPKTQTSSMGSPDGSKTLIIEKQKGQNTTSHTIYVSKTENGTRIQIPNRDVRGKDLVTAVSTASASATFGINTLGQIVRFEDLEIPYNTWSPDNVYFFLTEGASIAKHYYVFQSSGELFADTIPFISLKPLFEEQVPNYIIEDVTGWAGPTLLIVNTRAKEGGAKVSFWFDVPSQSFMQLGTYFR